MSRKSTEAAIKSCYSTWGESYYDNYYGPNAPYPPVHRDLIRRLLLEHSARTLLDAGCGPASFLRDLIPDDLDLYGFDLTPEMVESGKKVLAERGISPDRLWEGSVLDPEAYRPPTGPAPDGFDAIVCVGVLPHIPEDTDELLLRNLFNAVRPGGIVVVEARNQLFSLFTMNRYSHDLFISELVGAEALRERAGKEEEALDRSLEDLGSRFRRDIPPIRKGKADEPGYDEVLSRSHNPLVLTQQVAAAGFISVRPQFYHFHCLPPMYQGAVPELFRAESLRMERPDDWRGYFMASAFLVVGQRP